MLTKLLFLAIAVGLVFFFFRKKGVSKTETESTATEALEMKQDPICKSFVDETTRHKVKYYDKVYYFCSDDCKEKFIEEKKRENA